MNICASVTATAPSGKTLSLIGKKPKRKKKQ
jgi:hypothetical protein